MNFDDKQFEQLVKKSRRKRLINTLLGSTFSIIFLAVILLGGYLFYWNLGPFQGEKVAGVPDGQIRSFTENENGHLASLLLDYYGSYGFNVKGKKITVYADYYEKDKRISHEEVAGIENEEVGMISETLTWGILSSNDQTKEVRIQFTNTSGQSKSGFNFSTFGENAASDFAFSSFNLIGNGTLLPNKRYILQYWTTGGRGYSSEAIVAADKETLIESGKTVILYFEVS
ncbi:hypothetical protein [Enterococcus phoeniculicola]|jgi:FlaG/FlaF family flagellin (archaellin)|uniref:Uncharacterized protein n=1 Tax=Enterococcus phoeniculicola ATCC BAA-412 TaxID=1158610 RepID=R3W1X0_9ENTE|nr:hypothetical protein [Enterococcus phoeniculicola]EOL41662.1 hypothetical protein UC3_03227 [Enterococcus phoeniculicola ATCC BAA-412]EOT78844.1 hypothetical protein I589_00349 [Enterococcus phoeniculicola ATCC BAA-412]